MQIQKPVLYYFHDPMCSWCWGFKATLQNLCLHLQDDIEIKRVLGGLAADTDEPMPEALQLQIRDNWSRIESTIPGVEFNFDFWTKCQPRRSTYPACRAVIAARQQGEQYDELMVNAIQAAYYQQARNPSDASTLIELAKELELDEKVFVDDFYSEEVTAQLLKEVSFAREMYVESFPFLVFRVGGNGSNIKIDYNDYKTMLKQIEEIMNALH